MKNTIKMLYVTLLVLVMFNYSEAKPVAFAPSASVTNYSQITNYSRLDGAASYVNGTNQSISAPGQLLVFDITPRPTNDFSDYTSVGGVLIAEDGFRITIGSGCELGNAKILKISTLSDNANYARVLVWYPGITTPELDDTRCLQSQYVELVNFTIYKGSGATSGWNGFNTLNVGVTLSGFGETYPSEYLTGTVVDGNFVSAGYFYNNTTHLYKSLATCVSSPSQCPRKTGNVYNTIIMYYSGAGALDTSNFGNFWQAEAVPVFSGNLTPLTVSYFGAQGYSYEQANFTLNANVTPNQQYKIGFTSFLGLPYSLENGIFKVGSDN